LDFLWEYLLTGLRQCSDIHCVLLFVLVWTFLVAFVLLLFLLYRDTTHPLKDYSALNLVGKKAEKLQKSIREGFTILYDKCVEKNHLADFQAFAGQEGSAERKRRLFGTRWRKFGPALFLCVCIFIAVFPCALALLRKGKRRRGLRGGIFTGRVFLAGKGFVVRIHRADGVAVVLDIEK
jgi:hypothetical protein